MPKPLALQGCILEDGKPTFEGMLEVYLSGYSVSIHRQDRRGWTLYVVPFNGNMFLNFQYPLGPEPVLKDFQLSLAGPRIGTYSFGGYGADGDYDTFRLKRVEIQAAFGSAGIAVRIVASTGPAFSICWSAGERQENIRAPIEVAAEFLVPPHELENFLNRLIPDDYADAYGWPRVVEPEEAAKG